MKLRTIGSGRWKVFAICDDDGSCQILDFLQNLQPESLSRRMLSLLEQKVPANGPPHNEEISKYLDDKILEFRKSAHDGKQLRVLWFYDKGQIIICTQAFVKAERTPPGAIDTAKDLKNKYIYARENNAIEIIK